MKESTIYILTGSNLGNKEHFLKFAESNIENMIGAIVKKSLVYKSDAWGFKSDEFFLNQVLEVKTKLKPEDLLLLLQTIERNAGRKQNIKKTKYANRVLDIDILLYDNQIIHTTDLIIPHPRMHERLFTLKPLCDIAENIYHPKLHKTIKELLGECKDEIDADIMESFGNKP